MSDQFKTQEMCDKNVGKNQICYDKVVLVFMTQEMCNKVASVESGLLSFVPKQCDTQEMCEYAIDKYTSTLASVSKFFKIQIKELVFNY